jgi:hypothetical protein
VPDLPDVVDPVDLEAAKPAGGRCAVNALCEESRNDGFVCPLQRPWMPDRHGWGLGCPGVQVAVIWLGGGAAAQLAGDLDDTIL